MFLFIILFLKSCVFAADSQFLQLYGKAYVEYTQKLDEAKRTGKPLTLQQAKELEDQIFSDSRKAQTQEIAVAQEKYVRIGESILQKALQGAPQSKDKTIPIDSAESAKRSPTSTTSTTTSDVSSFEPESAKEVLFRKRTSPPPKEKGKLHIE